jgi:UDP-glucuronate 4-epimerase
MENILVTGGAGFIGSHLCERLIADNHKVICLDNFNSFYSEEIKHQNLAAIINHPNFTLVKGDIRNAHDLDSCFNQMKIDLVIHLAAMAGVRPSIEHPELYADVNIMGTLQVLQACHRNHTEKLIFASSSSVYGNKEGGAFKETDDVDSPISTYAATKRSSELLCYNWHSLYDLSVVCLRFFTVYGPRQRPDLAIHKFTNLMYHNEPIPVFGDGNSSRDYTYVDDTIGGISKAMEYIIEHKGFEVFNLGEAKTIKLKEMIAMIEAVSGKTAELEWLPRQTGDVAYTCADISKSRQQLDYNPTYSFEAGIRNFIKWFEQTNS